MEQLGDEATIYVCSDCGREATEQEVVAENWYDGGDSGAFCRKCQPACPHQHYRDVERCIVCELTEAEQALSAARAEVELWKQQESLANRQLFHTAGNLDVADKDLADARAALASRDALLLDLKKAVELAIYDEDGLDGSEGEPLLKRIEAMLSDAPPAAQGDQETASRV